MASLLGLGSAKVVHVVFFKFQADAEPHLVTKVLIDCGPEGSSASHFTDMLKIKICTDFTNLASQCLDANGKKYIYSIAGGKDMSIEGKDKGFTHAFVITFKSVQDRDYYIRSDPIHAAFAKVRRYPIRFGRGSDGKFRVS